MVSCYKRVPKYWFHVLQIGNDRIPNQVYIMLKNLDEQGKGNWASRTKELLHGAGFGFVWEEQEVGNEREFLNVFKERL